MKIFFSVLALLLICTCGCFAREIYDAQWCRKNGGTIEFDFEYNISFNCITIDVNKAPYIRKIYNILCIPCYSSILANETPVFLKIVSIQEYCKNALLDEFNYKVTESELVRYI